MPYVVRASEKTKASGAEYETKAMLYLMNCRDDSHEIYCFAIDFFNDVTGFNQLLDKAWDVLEYLLDNRPTSTMSDEQLERFAPWNEAVRKACGNEHKKDLKLKE